MARAVWNGAVIAESDDVEVVEGYTYFPAGDVDRRFLRDSTHRSVCPWKGTASYYDIVVEGKINSAAAWHYPRPSERAARFVAGRVGFWRGVKIEGDDGSSTGLLGRLMGRLR